MKNHMKVKKIFLKIYPQSFIANLITNWSNVSSQDHFKRKIFHPFRVRHKKWGWILFKNWSWPLLTLTVMFKNIVKVAIGKPGKNPNSIIKFRVNFLSPDNSKEVAQIAFKFCMDTSILAKFPTLYATPPSKSTDT